MRSGLACSRTREITAACQRRIRKSPVTVALCREFRQRDAQEHGGDYEDEGVILEEGLLRKLIDGYQDDGSEQNADGGDKVVSHLVVLFLGRVFPALIEEKLHGVTIRQASQGPNEEAQEEAPRGNGLFEEPGEDERHEDEHEQCPDQPLSQPGPAGEGVRGVHRFILGRILAHRPGALGRR